MKYRVHISRTGVRHAIVEVEAANPRLAQVKANNLHFEGKVDFGEEKDAEVTIEGVVEVETGVKS